MMRSTAPNAVRLCVAAPRSAALLEQALRVLAALIRAPESAENLI